MDNTKKVYCYGRQAPLFNGSLPIVFFREKGALLYIYTFPSPPTVFPQQQCHGNEQPRFSESGVLFSDFPPSPHLIGPSSSNIRLSSSFPPKKAKLLFGCVRESARRFPL